MTTRDYFSKPRRGRRVRHKFESERQVVDGSVLKGPEEPQVGQDKGAARGLGTFHVRKLGLKWYKQLLCGGNSYHLPANKSRLASTPLVLKIPHYLGTSVCPLQMRTQSEGHK